MEMTQSLREAEFNPADVWTQHATRAVFFIGGFGAASWAPLVPLLRQRLAIGEDILGLLLLCIGIGSLLTMPLSGAAAVRVGCRKVLTFSSIAFALLLFLLSQISDILLAIPVLLLFGAIMGCIDVVANVQAVIVEKAAGKRLMSGMHGLWSVGGFAGAGLFGVWVGGLGFNPTVSTLIATGIMVTAILFFARFLLPYGGDAGGKMLAVPKGIVAFVGVIACIAFLVEGAIMDWSGVFLTTVRGFDMSMAGTGFTVFSAAMLTMRLVGDKLVQKMGQKIIILGGSVLAFAGFLAVIFAPQAWLLYAGFFAIGVGSANVVPVFFSLLGKQKDMSIGLAVPAVSTLGYLGILMGPAAIGALAHATSLYAAFGLLAGLVALQFVIARYVYRKVL
ncbi:Nitrate/nitrite transporter NarK [Selenomonas ruminantium]|uniref:Nitrate/nitrite transporter NarK n=2 Tax=Selenomonas ruminantium TaxID=971 RepID=A0A1H4A0H4_SELRU|nr:Nitrate/nitrite transporter NarK [Selenomonas ruminantium]